MTHLIETQDRWNRTITLTEPHWNDHILNEHPEMAERLDWVRRAITEPDFVNHDPRLGRTELFYRHMGRVYVKVVVRFIGQAGTVRTAYLTTRIRRKETQKWPQ